MENIATLELYLPRSFFRSRKEVNGIVIEESPSELVSRNIISIATGIDSDYNFLNLVLRAVLSPATT